MKKKILLTAVVLAAFGILVAWGSAQAAGPYLVCDPNPGVIGYEVIGITTPGMLAAQADGSIRYDLGPLGLTDGTRTIKLIAYGVEGWPSAETPFVFTKSSPLAPAGVRIIPK